MATPIHNAATAVPICLQADELTTISKPISSANLNVLPMTRILVAQLESRGRNEGI